MSPRGVLDRSVRERLLATAEHLLAAGGPDAVSVRSIARAAGVAVGTLYNYFTDRDDLLVAVVLQRFQAGVSQAEELMRLAGSGDVADNVAAFGRAVVGSTTLPLAQLMLARPDLAERVRRGLDAEHQPGLDDIEAALADYLRAEQDQHRVAATVDPAAAAVLLVSAWHRVLLQRQPDLAAAQQSVNHLVSTAMTGLRPAESEQQQPLTDGPRPPLSR